MQIPLFGSVHPGQGDVSTTVCMDDLPHYFPSTVDFMLSQFEMSRWIDRVPSLLGVSNGGLDENHLFDQAFHKLGHWAVTNFSVAHTNDSCHDQSAL